MMSYAVVVRSCEKDELLRRVRYFGLSPGKRVDFTRHRHSIISAAASVVSFTCKDDGGGARKSSRVHVSGDDNNR